MNQVGIVISGRFPAAYRTLEGICAAGLSGRLITSHPRSRLPAYAFPPENLVDYGWLEYFYRGVERVPGLRRVLPAQWLKLVMLDWLGCRRLKDCAIVNGWSGNCLGLFRAARARGALCVLQTGSAHAAVQKRLVDDERRRYGIGRSATSSAVLRRQLLEYSLADIIVTPSIFVQRTFIEEGVPKSRIVVVPEGVDCASLLPQPKRDKMFRVLYIGHLSFRKGVVYLLEAARSFVSSEVELLVRGVIEPEFAPVLARYSGLYRHIGRVPAGNFADFVSQASVVVVPSIEDGWCAVTAEAMACGIPVIVSANTGTADTVREGVDGFVVQAGDHAAIAAHVDWLHEHPKERVHMGIAARTRALEFGWESYRTRIAALFAQLMTKGGR